MVMVNETVSEYAMPNGAKSCAYNADCVEKMREYPDGYFDLAVVDPPYGGGGHTFKGNGKTRFGGIFDKYAASERAEDGSKSTVKK